jgi:hypothetical protein
MRTLAVVTTLVVLGAATPCVAQQEGSGTFGVDFGMRASTGRGVELSPRASFTQLRLGIPLTPALSIEPTLFLAALPPNSPDLDLTLGVGLPYRLIATGVSPYLRPFADLRRGGRNVALAADVGFGLGLTAPLADRMDLRVEATAVRWLGTAAPSGRREGRLMVGLTRLR